MQLNKLSNNLTVIYMHISEHLYTITLTNKATANNHHVNQHFILYHH